MISEYDYFCFFDGSCPKNPCGEMGMGIRIIGYHPQFNSEFIEYESSWYRPADENNSSNTAEYLAVKSIMHYFQDHKGVKIIIFGDSKLVIKQLRNEMKMKSGRYKTVGIETKKLLLNLKKNGNEVTLEWIPRKENGYADTLSRRYQWDTGFIEKQLEEDA